MKEALPVDMTISHYRILARLGAGGMGEVYLAEDTKLRRKVALKLLATDLSKNEERLHRFEQEAQAASALSHPNVAHIYEIGEADGARFIAMEYVEGQSLDKKIGARPLGVAEILDIAIQIADALDEAHAKGITHRDIKSSNIMVTSRGRVKVLDFGLAKLSLPADSSEPASDSEIATRVRTTPGVVLGTVNYMSPEQALGREVDHRTDIFSFGVVLYEMATGRLPFVGETATETIDRIEHAQPEAIARLNYDVPAEVEVIVKKALRKNRDERYQTVHDVLVDLRDVRHELDIAERLEHSLAPSQSTAQSATTQPSAPATISPPSTTDAVAARRTSSAEYIVSEIRRHKTGAAVALVVFVIVIAGIAFAVYKLISQNQSPSRASGPAPRVVPFTSFPGSELSPTFSPDGNQIAFAWDGEKGDNVDIYVKLIDAGGPVRLTTHPDADLSPAWSPDGRYIAFSRVSKSERGIFIIPALGGPERKLSPASALIGDASVVMDLALHLSWSPDGKFLAFSAPETPQEPSSIFLLSVETLEKRQLMPPPPGSNWGDLHPTFSPDGMTLAFARGAGTNVNDLYLVPAVGGEPKRLTFDNQRVFGLTWTPDGREIIFSSNRGGSVSLWRIAASGGTPERLAAGGENGRSPALSRQGNRLAYAQSISDLDIWRIELPNSAGKAPTRFISSTRAELHQQFSPDGKRIAFESNRSGTEEIWVCDSEGLNCTQLTFFGGPPAGSPRWSPDGQRLAFDCIQAGNKDIYVVSVEGGKPRRLTTEPSDEVRPSWSRDGRWIYFGSNRTGSWQVWKAPVEGGQAVQVTKQGGREAFESPDGKFVYYTKGPGLTSIWRVPVEGGEEIQILDQIPQGSWAVLDRGIYFVNTRTTPRQAIEFFSFATGQATRIVTLEKPAGGGLTISPDGRWLLYTQVELGGSDIMLIENFR